MWNVELSGRRIRLTWILGHSGVLDNEEADKLAAITTTPESVVAILFQLKAVLGRL